MNTIKTVVFDLGGVLVDLDIDRCTGAFRSLGMDAVADLINPYYPAEMIGRLEHGVISFHEACDEMRRLSGTPEVTDAQIAWAYGQFLVRIPVAKLRQIDALRERGIRTCVLSNNNHTSLVSIIAVADLLRRGREFASQTFDYFETYTVIALVYLIITLLLSKGVSMMEGRLTYYDRDRK